MLPDCPPSPALSVRPRISRIDAARRLALPARVVLLAVWSLAWLTAPAPAADNVELRTECLQKARAAWNQQDAKSALEWAGKAIQAAPDGPTAWSFRASLYEALSESRAAIADLDQVIQREPAAAEVYNRRGSEQFKLGQFAASIADFDRFIKLRPDEERSHWKRGISYYYAGQFEAGQKQFEGYQTFDDNDVENAVWRWLCMARRLGVEQARKEILKIKEDRRVPMMQIYQLYAGQGTIDQVWQAVEAGQPGEAEANSRRFYAHLYLGLYHEALGQLPAAREQMKLAEKHKIGHYMHDVARVHRQVLEQSK